MLLISKSEKSESKSSVLTDVKTDCDVAKKKKKITIIIIPG